MGEEQNWLWGQINKILPMKIGLRVLYCVLGNEQWINLERFREEAKKHGAKKSMQITIERTGTAIFISAITTICGFAVLFLSPMPLTQHFGIITAATIVYSFVLAVFILPILLVAWALSREKNKLKRG